ncbi:pantoate--beta-alanine ligase [Halobacillus shinanisalinarum]|uniref:Pantothenate synthetase n=1 Tax=Halobacillus shinanisalinarum TaxID=2932258 RepID=A0ABY4GZU5_9BACI|nr:pantoate--beta-alanine ligase [Halobacillus shinanisalinarum]UOQ93556.1 pantoate--beta-alanine ligase [Halobacillus shinanisalinarum]
MEIITSIKQLQHKSISWIRQGKSIGFVPTMGYLHEGHEALMKKARQENDIVILSIFVNPLQFGENEDLDSYPRDEEHDRKVAEENEVDVIFFPSVDSMYPKRLSLELSVVRRADVLCGKSRPGHFDGVVTVLAKLFNIIHPTRVYFGMKDAQQIAVVDALIEDFNYPIDLVAVPTVREEDGLAKSSRNVNLFDQERVGAPSIHQALQYGRQLVENGEKSKSELIKKVRQFLENKSHGNIDYIELLAYPKLELIEFIDQQVILAVAVYYQKARLIDNVVFNEKGDKTLG